LVDCMILTIDDQLKKGIFAIFNFIDLIN